MARAALLERSLALLRLFEQRRVWRFGELAAELPVSEPTLAAMLKQLVAAGWLAKTAGGYELGGAVLSLAGTALGRLDLRAPGRRVLLELRQAVGETVELSVPNGDGLLFIDQVEGPEVFELYVFPGRFVRRLHAFAPGKLLLAERDRAWREAFYAGSDFAIETGATITDPQQLEGAIATLRSEGRAEDVDEARLGVSRVARAVRDPSGRLAAMLSVVAPTARLGVLRGDATAEALSGAAIQLGGALEG